MTNKYDSVKKLYKRQEELEQEYFSRKKDYDKTLEKIAEMVEKGSKKAVLFEKE